MGKSGTILNIKIINHIKYDISVTLLAFSHFNGQHTQTLNNNITFYKINHNKSQCW